MDNFDAWIGFIIRWAATGTFVSHEALVHPTWFRWANKATCIKEAADG